MRPATATAARSLAAALGVRSVPAASAAPAALCRVRTRTALLSTKASTDAAPPPSAAAPAASAAPPPAPAAPPAAAAAVVPAPATAAPPAAAPPSSPGDAAAAATTSTVPAAAAAAAATTGSAKRQRGEWWYVGWATLASVVLGGPLLLIAAMQDDADVRDWVEERLPPGAMELLREYWAIPHSSPAGWRASEQPKGADRVQALVAGGDGTLELVEATAATPASSLLEGRPPGAAVLAAGRLWEANSAPPPLPRRRLRTEALGDVDDGAVLHRQGIWSLETRGSLARALAGVDADAAAEAAHVAALRADAPHRPLLAAVAQERASALAAWRAVLAARLAGFGSAPLLVVTPPAVPSGAAAGAGEASSTRSSWGMPSLLTRWWPGGRSGAAVDDGCVADPLDPDDLEPGSTLAGAAAGSSSKASSSTTVRSPSRLFFDAGEGGRVHARLSRQALQAYVRGTGEVALAQAYTDAGVERYPKAPPVTLGSLLGIGGGGSEAEAPKADTVAAAVASVAGADTVVAATAVSGDAAAAGAPAAAAPAS
jgi:hypothetical protein